MLFSYFPAGLHVLGTLYIHFRLPTLLSDHSSEMIVSLQAALCSDIFHLVS